MDDVTVPNSPLDIHLRRLQQLQDCYNSEINRKKSKITSVFSFMINFVCSFINHSQILPLFAAPWRLLDRAFAVHVLLPFCVKHEIISDEEESQLKSKFPLQKLTKPLVAFLLLAIVICPWWLIEIIVFFVVFLPSVPFALNCFLYSFALGPYSVALTKSMRRCTNLLAEIHVVHLGFVYATKCRPTTDLLDRLASEQSREALSSIQLPLDHCMSEVRSLVSFYFERSIDMPPSVKTRRLVSGRRSFNCDDLQESCSTTTVRMRKTFSFTVVHLYDLTVAVARCIFAFSFDYGFIVGHLLLMKLLARNIFLCFKFHDLVSKMERACQTAAFTDLKNSFSNIEQFSKFASHSRREIDDEKEKCLQNFALHLVSVNQKTNAELLPLIGKRVPDSPPVLDELSKMLHSCITLLSQAKKCYAPQRISSDVPIERPSLVVKEKVTEQRNDPNSDDDLQLFFADTTEDDITSTLPVKSRQNVTGDLEKPSSVQFLVELRSVLSERTKATEMKEREILKRRGIDIDSILVEKEETVEKSPKEYARQPILLDEETKKLRAALVADFKRFPQHKPAKEVVLCGSSSDSSDG